MDLEEGKAAVLRLLQERGKAKNSEMIEVCGGDRELFDLVREDLIFNDQAEDKKGVGLVYIGAVEATLETPPSAQVAKQPTVTAQPPELFVSYDHDDFSEVREIVRHLQDAKVEVWWDKTGVGGGPWRQRIADAIRTCKAIALMCSSESIKSENVRDEIDLAADEGRERLPLHLDEAPHSYPTTIALSLAGKHWVSIVGRDPEDWIPEVLAALDTLGISCDLSYRPAVARPSPPAVVPARAVPSLPAPPSAMGAPGPRMPTTAAPRRFRVFISSTYSDLMEERSALMERVFPRLKDLCLQHGARFEAIDLRWGISEEAALDQQTMNLDLAEIDRCFAISPRLNFIVLLGDRYGWRPPPPQIPEQEFDEILSRISNDERYLLQEWYLRDDNAVPPEFYLKPRVGQFVDGEIWYPIEERIQSILERVVVDMPLEGADRLKYEASSTEQEIHRGALRLSEPQAFCFFRTIRGLPEDETARGFTDLDEMGARDADGPRRLHALKDRLRAFLPGQVREYEAGWLGEDPDDPGRPAITTDHIDPLCNDVYESLSRVILDEVNRLESVDPLDREIDEHHDFGRERTRFFVGGEDALRRIGEHTRMPSGQPLAVVGSPGSGKSALLARAAEDTRVGQPSAAVVQRFIGTTPESSEGQRLLEGLCREISRYFGLDEASVPSDYPALSRDFPERLTLATVERPLILFLDGLDRLSDAHGARGFGWLPSELPQHVSLVVSTSPGEPLDALMRRLPDAQLLEMSPMSANEGAALLDLWLEDAGRTLQGHQRDEILGKFEAEQRPLFLSLAFQEARRWKSTDGFPRTELPPTVRGIVEEKLLARLERRDQHGPVLVPHALAYLAAAKNGLSEDEVLDVLSRDREVMEDFIEHSPRAPGVDRLPPVIWSRLYFDLEPYLTERSVDGTRLLTFSHRWISEAVGERYLAGYERVARHHALAAYFAEQPLQIGGPAGSVPNLRKMSELPYQLTMGEEWDEVVATLTDFQFLEGKASTLGVIEAVDTRGNVERRYTGVDLLAEDYALALQRRPGGEVRLDRRRLLVTAGDFGNGLELRCPFCNQTSPFQAAWQGTEIECPQCGGPLRVSPFVIEWGRDRPASSESQTWPIQPERERQAPDGSAPLLERFVTALQREAHVLRRRPDLIWQQLFNRLQWTDDSVRELLAPEVARRTVRGAKPWMRVRTPFGESSAYRQTLQGHAETVKGCDVSRDGSLIVSAGADYTVKLWDTATGAELASLVGHEDWVNGCAISPDGSFVVSAGSDRTLKVWDAATGRELRTIEGHTDPVNACAISPDGGFIVSASDDRTVRMWDTATGEEVATLHGHEDAVRDCSLSPTGGSIVSASDDGTVRVWDARTREQLATLRGHEGAVLACATSPDGSFIVSASDDRTVRIWDAATGGELVTLTGHDGTVRACAVGPDGLLVSGGDDMTLRIWDATIGLEEATLIGHAGPITACAVTPDARTVVSGSRDGTLKTWDATRREARRFHGHTGAVFACAMAPEGRFVASAGSDGTLRVWDPETGQERLTVNAHIGAVLDCAIAPDGSFVLSASDDGTLKALNTDTGEEQATLRGHRRGVRGCALSTDGSIAVSASDDGTLKIWDTASWEEGGTLTGHSSSVNRCAISPDGSFVVSTSDDETVRIWDVATRTQRERLVGHSSSVYGCAISPDGTYIVSASWDGTLKIWDVAQARQRAELLGHTDQVWDCAVSPDGEFIASASWDGSLRIWDPWGNERAALVLPSRLTSVALHPALPLAVCGDVAGGLHWIDLIGFEREGAV